MATRHVYTGRVYGLSLVTEGFAFDALIDNETICSEGRQECLCRKDLSIGHILNVRIVEVAVVKSIYAYASSFGKLK
jgi:hypothetical protein